VAAPRREAAAAVIREMIANGTLLPGAPVPSGAELARKAGCGMLTGRAALRLLLADGTLARGASANARLRVAATDGGTRPALSAALAARRRASGLTQPELAAAVGMSLTTVGHAETGRLWQSRDFWQRADLVLGASGALLRMYDQHQAGPVAPVMPVSIAVTAAGVLVTWPGGIENLVAPPDG
jgi:Helix-turn-helix domain/Bacterial regulatory proteins, gntR family